MKSHIKNYSLHFTIHIFRISFCPNLESQQFIPLIQKKCTCLFLQIFIHFNAYLIIHIHIYTYIYINQQFILLRMHCLNVQKKQCVIKDRKNIRLTSLRSYQGNINKQTSKHFNISNYNFNNNLPDKNNRLKVVCFVHKWFKIYTDKSLLCKSIVCIRVYSVLYLLWVLTKE